MKSCLCFIMLSLISALLSCACKIDDDKVGDHFYGAQLCAIVQSLSVSADYSTCYTTGGEKNQTFSESGTTCTYIIPANLTYWHCRYQ